MSAIPDYQELLCWVVLLPLSSATVLLLWRGVPKALVTLLGVGSVVGSALLTALIGGLWLQSPEPFTQVLWSWIQLESFTPRIALHFDGLALTMLGVITGVGALIHGYASGYMRDDPGYRAFFAYMNLFVAMMVLLVLADNLLLLYLGWEGVGLCSYLLIGFWHQDPANGAAARKAFITTRVGDTAMAIGLFLLYRELKTLDIEVILASAAAAWRTEPYMPTLIALLILGGAVGKSAQLPLQTWLPDAMAGPTPVSALIHAATMVTAGVYLVARLHGLFLVAPGALEVVGWIGAVTLLLAGGAALAQSDIKRVLAYSTMSQIGYMFMALGAGAWQAAIFHLMTHAFFKALLFLAAGSVILACHHEQDIFRMGGLRRRLPLAFAAFVVGGAALAALPVVTAGFWSKEAILAGAWSSGHVAWWAMGVACAFLTGLYTFRLVFIVFFGAEKIHAHDADLWRMRVPLGVLMLLSVLGGAIALPLAGVLPGDPPTPSAHWPAIVAVAAGLAGIALAWRWYGRGAVAPEPTALRRLAQAGWGFDALYGGLFVRPLYALATANRADLVDRGYGVIVAGLGGLHRMVLRLQTGRLRWYAAAMAAGMVLLLGAVQWT
ncbi:NADH dehydrogenase subunit L [Fontimonas thermophila]|uniref:NADH dehydrogenase subunit L n=1 Tax=Fontimonas thermophila TaxID=1076937 RepID=A0A1I2JZ09_9GAMM|nr:NADH-quinone oxidoreductase subunit L [Fontimonas thermophila]SFF57986.1 NADH dehydrogenase subunit L [Fontimonas thermophila]